MSGGLDGRPGDQARDKAGSGARRCAEYKAKLVGVEWELARWVGQAAAGGPMATHHTQLRALSAVVGSAVAELRAEVEAVPADWSPIEGKLARLDRYWDFFRSKLVLHQSPVLGAHLRIADEYAWSCYAPADPGRCNEPPLSFLSPAIAPYAVSRGVKLPGEEVYRRLARTVPIPLIGIPWVHLFHLPGVVILGHEVGHQVERDFGLTGTIGSLLEGVPGHLPGRASEIFADVYGALAGGSAFALAMADFLADGDNARQGNDRYPAVAFRLELIAATLALHGSAGPPAPGPAAETAERLVTARYPGLGGRPLNEVISLAEGPADKAAGDLVRPKTPPADLDIRQLMAGATLAFHDDPGRYATKDVAAGVLRHAAHLAARAEGVRNAVAPPDRTDRDRRAAAAFADLLDDPLP